MLYRYQQWQATYKSTRVIYIQCAVHKRRQIFLAALEVGYDIHTHLVYIAKDRHAARPYNSAEYNVHIQVNTVQCTMLIYLMLNTLYYTPAVHVDDIYTLWLRYSSLQKPYLFLICISVIRVIGINILLVIYIIHHE